jgi:hypothetical protein
MIRHLICQVPKQTAFAVIRIDEGFREKRKIFFKPFDRRTVLLAK